MNKLFNAIPLLVLLVLGVLGVKQYQGMGNREQGTGNREGGIGNKTVSANSQLCEVVKGSIYDGDTLRVKCGEAIAKVRLACVDAREMKMTGGTQDRDFLRSLINKHGSTVALIPLEQDRYGRVVAELILNLGETPEVSIQEELLKSGHARIYPAYDDCPNINAFRLAESIGQKNKAGVWSEPNPEPPWEWRRRNR